MCPRRDIRTNVRISGYYSWIRHRVQGDPPPLGPTRFDPPRGSTGPRRQRVKVIITMGCGDTCPFYPGKRYEDWVLDDPAGQGIEAIRPIRDEIQRRVEMLIGELVPV